MGQGLDRQKYRVLLLSAPIGAGHQMAAKALAQELQAQGWAEVVEGDVFSFFPAWLGRLFLRGYLLVLKYCPSLYQLCYRWGDGQEGSIWLRQLINRVLLFLGRGYLDQAAPDAVLATHATPAGIVGLYKDKHPRLFLGAVVTDFCLHRWWLNQGVDAYFTAAEELRQRLPQGAVGLVTGIPVRQEVVRLDRQAERRRLQWQGRVCLFLGGGEGLLPMEAVLQALIQQGLLGWHLVFLTGHNQGKAERLGRLAQQAGLGREIEVYSFREDGALLAAAADLVVTKAGGLTCAELLAAQVPFILYQPLPGQEQGNAAYLQRHGAARVAHSLAELLAALAEPPPGTAASLARPQAAQAVCTYLARRLALDRGGPGNL